MSLNKIGRVIRNPEVFGIFLKSKNVYEVRLHLRIKEARKKMIIASQMADSLLDAKKSIEEIVEIVSSKTRMTKYPIRWYCLVSKYKPSIIVETGTSMDWSSFMILTAIKK